MRTLSLTFLEAMFSEQTDEVPVVLLTITHVDSPVTMRFASTGVRLSTSPLLYGVISRGNTYNFIPFSAQIPDDKDETPPESKLVLDNFDPNIIALLRSTTTPAQITMEIVLLSSPDNVEIEFDRLDLTNADYDESTITLTLSLDSMMTEPYPSGTFEPAGFSGLF